MFGHEAEVVVKQSLLDRLLDESKGARAHLYENMDEPNTYETSISRLKAGVALDLEWLLNTRQNLRGLPQDSELQVSLLSYGLPDTTSMSLHSQRDQQRLRLSIESTIAKFEPRLTQLQVLMDSVPAQGHILRFRIEAVLRVGRETVPVTFNTMLEVNSGQYQVK